MAYVALTGKQKRQLRALGHHLQVVVQVGGDGVTAGVVKAAAQALKDHELIKVKIEAEREERAEALEALVTGTGSEVAQTLGKTALLFKQREKKPGIRLVEKAARAAEKASDAAPDVADDDESA